MFKKAWNSPTITTWMSYSSQALSLLGLIPLILKKFTPGDVALWYLFSTIIALQSIADFGFRQTFTRLISFAYGGARDIDTFSPDNKNKVTSTESTGPNIPLMHSIVSTMKHIYKRLTVVLFFLLLIFGTWSMVKPIRSASHPDQAWIAWTVILLVSCVNFYGKIYLNYLEGLFKIAMVRRVETLRAFANIMTCIGVLYFSPSLLNLVIVNQFWALTIILRDITLCKRVEDGLYTRIARQLAFNKQVFLKIWQPAWRSGISGFMSVGLYNLTGVVYAQIGSSPAVASYLLVMRIISQIRDISMAPFYSKIPLMARLRVQHDIKGLVKLVQRGMLLSHLVFVVGFVTVGLFANQLLTLIHSKVEFVDQTMWLLMGVAFFIHRFGAMHMQVYLSTNHVISHIADGISGILYIVSTLMLARYIGIYAIPIGMLIGYLGFYAWYAAKFSYKSLQVNFLNFEKLTSFVPLVILMVYTIFELLLK
ncbi:hypothetical protein [Danxiaibacter flavus]